MPKQRFRLKVPKDITTTKIQSGSTSTLLPFGSDSNTIFINIILLADSLDNETLQSQQEQSKDLNHHTKTTQKRNPQEPSEEYSSSDVEIINSIPTKITRLSSPNILLEDETISQNLNVTNLASPKNHISTVPQHEMTSTNSTLHSSIKMQVLQNHYMQKSLLQKKPEEVRQEIGNVAIPIQFQNEFEIAYWLAHHKRILDLATNIRNGMIIRTNEGDDSALPSQQFSYEPLLIPVEIDQDTYKADGEAEKENIPLKTNKLTFEKRDFEKNQDNIEVVVDLLTSEESINLNIAAHNIDGIASVPSIQKLHNLLEFINENSIDIMAISETNIDYRQEYFINQDIKSKREIWVWSIYAAPNNQDMRKSLIEELKMAMEGHNRSVHNTVVMHVVLEVTNSHHSIISTTLNISGFIKNNFWHCVPDQLQDPDLHQGKRIVDISKITDVQWENFTETLDRKIEAWDFQQLIKKVNYEIQLGDEKNTDGEEIKFKYLGSRNTRYKLSFADKTMRHTTKLGSLIRKICKDQDFIAAKDTHWIDYWLNRFNKYNDDYKRKEYDKFIAQRLSKIQDSIEKRCNIIHSNIPKWLLSIQDVVKEHIIIDRAVISNENESVRLALDPNTIRTYTKDTFAGILRKCNTKSIEQDIFWSNIYRPKSEFTECIANLMDEITLKE
ncbi:hypothetical protein C1646_770092 [Rhizophagus diaphanus]|nr:hypothetical protein C1646_770092 [Rhizophagus diaphanus] [Rhizophagus sp. MUCL 43196]